MFCNAFFCEFLTAEGLIDGMYDALNKGDGGNIVITALDILQKTKTEPLIQKKCKSETNSNVFCRFGDMALQDKKYDAAIRAYNEAILLAPKDSNMLTNISLGKCPLLHNINAFSECLIEIEKCLKGIEGQFDNNPQKIHRELKQLQDSCLQSQWSEFNYQNAFINEFFKFNVDKHPSVPCVSVAVNINTEGGLPNVVAAKNISVGSLVALETAYVAELNENNRQVACHYCHKFSFNLIPCDSCCVCLFCSEDCKQRCWNDYHSVECHIIHLYDEICPNRKFALSVRAALKLKMSCSWEEFITLTSNMGSMKMRASSTNEIYDVNNKSSILNFNDVTHYKHGSTFNGSFAVATVIHYLKDVPSFYPGTEKEKNDAMRALGRVILNLLVAFPEPLELTNGVRNFKNMLLTTEPEFNYGFFSFISKLKHSCDPNLLNIGLNNKVALLAIKPIKAGDELRISHIGHWYENTYGKRRRMELFTKLRIMCQCAVCEGQWSPLKTLVPADMDKQQRTTYNKWRTQKLHFNPYISDTEKMFKESIRCLNVISDLPNTNEHYKVFKTFRDIVTFLQFHATKNVILL